VISLTESHHQVEQLQNHFALHHIGIEDLNAQNLAQVHQLAEIIKSAKSSKARLAVHCLAGIGRTSTMLMASHIVMGERADAMEALLKKQNPKFVLIGSQGEFVRSLANPI
jgi:atypical dual specificity phosphatase